MVNDFSATVIVGVDFTNSSRLSSGLTAFGLSGVARWSGFAVSVVMSALPVNFLPFRLRENVAGVLPR